MTAAELREQVEAALVTVCHERFNDLPPAIAEPVRYSLEGGGKRLRGMLLLAAYRASGGSSDASRFAAAVEIVHAYSLVHDDLPCMDDDDMRRGRPTTHRVFGVPAAIVAGSVMIPLAARLAHDSAIDDELPPGTCCTIVKLLMHAAGAGGMIAGQLLDLEAEETALSRDELDVVHCRKTGALISASLGIGGVAACASTEAVDALTSYGSRIGLAFQIMDDVLDVTSSTANLGKIAGRDVALGKSTYPALLGVEGATARAVHLVDIACEELRRHGLLTGELEELAGFVVSRNN